LGPRNRWKEVPNGDERYEDAMCRHMLKEWAGEELDTDSELHHAAHRAWNALAYLELLIKKKEEEEGSEKRTSIEDAIQAFKKAAGSIN